MNILNVNMSLDPVLGGGTTERTSKLHRALNELEGVEAHVLTTDAGVEDLKSIPVPLNQATVLPCWNQRWYLPAPHWMTVRRLVAWADVVHLMNHWTLLNAWVYIMARWMKKPYVLCPAGSLKIYGRSSTFKRLYNFMVGGSIIKNAGALIAITEDEARLFQHMGVSETNIIHIPNGVWEKDFTCKDESLFRNHFKLGEAPFLLYVGRLNSIKGPDLLVEAFARVVKKYPELHLALVGPDGGLRNALQTRIQQKELADKIHLTGFSGGDLKSSAYHGAELVVVPSRHEAMSIVALESGICGTPVLLSDQCGFNALAEAGGGRITPVDIDIMAESIETMLEDRSALKEMGSRARHFIRDNYSWLTAAQNHVDLYMKIVSEQK